jgi:hypothetical protein
VTDGADYSEFDLWAECDDLIWERVNFITDKHRCFFRFAVAFTILDDPEHRARVNRFLSTQTDPEAIALLKLVITSWPLGYRRA